MSSNPYQPPSPLAFDPIVGRQQRRPIGISILAVLHAIGGLLIGALGVFLATQFDESDADSIIAWTVVIAAPLLTVLSFATAIGLWQGKQWAWWLATFYYFQFAIGGIFVLASIAVAYFVLDRPVTERSEELLVKHVGRLLIFSLLTWYMMKGNVFAYFRFERLTRLRALCILGAIVLVIGILVGLLTVVALGMGARP
ncbi:MAG: hypothetical protein WD872_18705 [Pirellulaceae bacterium]